MTLSDQIKAAISDNNTILMYGMLLIALLACIGLITGAITVTGYLEILTAVGGFYAVIAKIYTDYVGKAKCLDCEALKFAISHGWTDTGPDTDTTGPQR